MMLRQRLKYISKISSLFNFIIIDYNNNISSSKVREMIKNNKDLTNVLETYTIRNTTLERPQIVS